MRHNSVKVRDMIAGPDVPQRQHGGPALCHGCQRSVYFKGGIVEYLAAEVARRAKYRGLRDTRTGELETGNVLPEVTDDENLAYERFVAWRWPHGIRCPRCGGVDIYRFAAAGRKFKCRECRAHFSATTGTVFSNRKLPFVAALKLLNAGQKNALQLSAEIGLTYKTVWALTKKLRQPLNGQR